eukprot:GHUV01015036.1.p1 GENE.GHUV01015036.1~~GHUV01015036.1.p1  ORF type:complete len:378 (+),score=122.93 GHUV01015036.1:225-1358(+)
MPQNRSKHSGKPFDPPKVPTAARTDTQDPSTATAANGISSTWQRGQGGFSGKAKKDYLKWKRQQKAAAASTDDDSDWLPETTSSTASNPAVQDSTAGRLGASSTHAPPATAAGASPAAPGFPVWQENTTDDPAAPLRYRPLVAVPAAPFDARSPIDAARSESATASAAVGSCTATAEGSQGSQDDAGVGYMPTLDPAEVGFTWEGFKLDMPTRPQWQGVVNTAEELYVLEEQQFAAWQKSLLEKAQIPQPEPADPAAGPQNDLQQQQQQQSSRAGGIGRLSFYEGRLDFWRQLWRTLEMSDIVLMILDARNPLLHFSHALYRHITRDHKLPLIILLNKCDLIPAANAGSQSGARISCGWPGCCCCYSSGRRSVVCEG